MSDTPRTDAEVRRMQDARYHCSPELVPKVEADFARQLELENEKMRQALGLMVRWGKSEEAGPDYCGMTRDTHPQGEEIWKAWWNNNLDLCARAQDAMQEALSNPADRTAKGRFLGRFKSEADAARAL